MDANNAIYASAKSAVEGLTRGMAVELGKHNIRVNAIGPDTFMLNKIMIY